MLVRFGAAVAMLCLVLVTSFSLPGYPSGNLVSNGLLHAMGDDNAGAH